MAQRKLVDFLHLHETKL